MPENLMNSAHKSNSDAYRKEYERIFKQTQSLIYGEPYGAIPIDPLRYGFLVVTTQKENKDA